MPEHIRKIASRLRQFVADRRRAPRYRVSLPVSVSLLGAEGSAEPALVQGRTRDLSEELKGASASSFITQHSAFITYLKTIQPNFSGTWKAGSGVCVGCQAR